MPRRGLRRRGILPRSARKGIESSERLGRFRWIVERTNAWMLAFRRLTVRYDRQAASVLAFLHLACALSCLGDHAGARRWLDQFLRVIEASGSPEVRLVGLLPLATCSLHTNDYARALAYAAEALRTARAFSSQYGQADALVLLGHAQAGLHRLSVAATSYSRALALYQQLENAPLTAEPRAGLAAAASVRGDRQRALALVEEVLEVLRDHPRAGLDEPFTVYLTCYRILSARRDPRAGSVLRAANGLLRAYASAVAEPELRRSFLMDHPVHRELQVPPAGVRAGRRIVPGTVDEPRRLGLSAIAPSQAGPSSPLPRPGPSDRGTAGRARAPAYHRRAPAGPGEARPRG
jgi:tetratricopeptide (TPR) repeat protein